MLHHERRLDPESRALLDGERLVLQRVERPGLGEVDRDIGPSLYLEGEGPDDAFAGVVEVTNCGAGAQPQGRLPSVEGIVVLV